MLATDDEESLLNNAELGLRRVKMGNGCLPERKRHFVRNDKVDRIIAEIIIETGRGNEKAMFCYYYYGLHQGCRCIKG